MAQNRMMPPALLEQLQGADTDVLRRVLEHAMQRLIEAEAATQIGAGPHERASTRTTYRNGYRERILDTGSGRLELQIPKLRSGSFFPTLLEPRRRIDRVKAAGAPSYTYDAADNLTQLTSGTNQLFDAADELCWTSSSTGSSCGSPPSGATTYTYDTNGNRTASTHGATVVDYGYDEANRLVSYTSATQTASYTYNGDGLRMSKTVNGTPTPFTWDTASSTPLLLSDGTTDYIYGINGTPVEQEAAQPTISVIGEGSATGGTGASTVTVNFPAGYPVGDEIYVATTQSNTTTVSAPGTYTLVTSVASGGTAPKAGTTVYDHTIVASESSVTISYGGTSSAKAVVLADYRGVDPTLPVDVYDSATTAGGTSVVAPSVSPAYANDRLLVFQGARGTFSSQSWTGPAGMTERVQINSMANVSAGLADLTLSAAGSTGTETSTFVASANLTTIILAIPQPPSILFYQSDQLGSTRLLTDSAGVVRGTFSYDAYGNLIGTSGSYSSPLGWASQYGDAESGLVYLDARYYDRATGQFLTVDPEVAITLSPYAYVADDPLNATDPTGRIIGCGQSVQNQELSGGETCSAQYAALKARETPQAIKREGRDGDAIRSDIAATGGSIVFGGLSVACGIAEPCGVIEGTVIGGVALGLSIASFIYALTSYEVPGKCDTRRMLV